MTRQRGWRFWIDRGGTFTDLIACAPDGHLLVRKVLSEAAGSSAAAGLDPAVAALRDVLELTPGEPLPPGLIEEVRLGTTVATNALLERQLEPVLLLVNRGLADLIHIGDQHRPDLFALQIQRPIALPLRVLEVTGRLGADGRERQPLEPDAPLAAALQTARAEGYRRCAVALLHSTRNPAHELALRDWLQQQGWPEVLLSHQLSSQPRLVPRLHTTAVEAAIRPVLRRYLDRVQAELGPATRLRVMTSSGALLAPADLAAKDTILSGPAGGLLGAVAAARSAGFAREPLLGFDMGGTSTDVFHLESAADLEGMERHQETVVDGLRVQAPMLPIHTVAAGGGSVLQRLDGRLLVGPRSAGADPGPLCYRRGGPLTVTDANLLLGRLPASTLPRLFGPGGDQPADAEAVRRAFTALAAAQAGAGPWAEEGGEIWGERDVWSGPVEGRDGGDGEGDPGGEGGGLSSGETGGETGGNRPGDGPGVGDGRGPGDAMGRGDGPGVGNGRGPGGAMGCGGADGEDDALGPGTAHGGGGVQAGGEPRAGNRGLPGTDGFSGDGFRHEAGSAGPRRAGGTDPLAAERLARGALDIANERMAEAIRRISIQQGHDLRQAVLVCYGGAGGQHACALAAILGLARVLIHPLSGVLSAWGIGQAPLRQLQQRNLRQPFNAALMPTLAAQVQELHREALRALERQAGGPLLLPPQRRVVIELRSAGSERGLELELPLALLPDAPSPRETVGPWEPALQPQAAASPERTKQPEPAGHRALAPPTDSPSPAPPGAEGSPPPAGARVAIASPAPPWAEALAETLRQRFAARHRQRFGYAVAEETLVLERLQLELVLLAESGTALTNSALTNSALTDAALTSAATPPATPESARPTSDPGPAAAAPALGDDPAALTAAVPAAQAAPLPLPTPELVPLCLQEGDDLRWQTVPRWSRQALRAGQRLEGPALVVEHTGVTVVEPHWCAAVLAGGLLVLERSPAVSPQAGSTSKASALAIASATAGAESQAGNPAPWDPACAVASADPVQLELYNHRFTAIAAQMGVRLQQSSRSVNIRERLDFSCALFDREGRLVANAPHIPVHLGSMGESVVALRQAVARGLLPAPEPGDAVAANNPFNGGTHLPDITVITPVFAPEDQGDPLAYVACRGHHADVGGITPGSMPPFSRVIAEEGLLLDNVYLLRRGRLLQEQWRPLLGQGPHPVRDPEQLLADLQAQVAANRLGVAELQRLMARQGSHEVCRFMGQVQANAAEAVRRVITQLRDGAHVVELDDGGRIAVRVMIDRAAGRARVDFSGTTPQQSGNGNAPLAITRAVVLYVFRCLVGQDIPLNAGCFEPIDLVVPEGCLLHPRPPAAVVAGNVETSQAVANALFAALGVMAAAQGTMNNLSFGNARWQYYETICGGSGAGRQLDGVGFTGADAVQTHMTNSRLTDPEILEERFPVLLERFAIRRGSGGRGRWRGGDGVERQLRFLEPMSVSILSGARRVAPFGLAGGGAGAPGRNALLQRDGQLIPLEGRAQLEVAAGDVLCLETPGGGGYGLPLEGSPPDNA